MSLHTGSLARFALDEIRVELLQAEDERSVKLSLEIEVEEDLQAIAQVSRGSRDCHTYYSHTGYGDSLCRGPIVGVRAPVKMEED